MVLRSFLTSIFWAAAGVSMDLLAVVRTAVSELLASWSWLDLRRGVNFSETVWSFCKRATRLVNEGPREAFWAALIIKTRPSSPMIPRTSKIIFDFLSKPCGAGGAEI